MARSSSSRLFPQQRATRSSTSDRKVESAPWRVRLPISSLSNRDSTVTFSWLSAAKKSLRSGKDALQVVQAGSGDKLVVRAEHSASRTAVQIQVPREDVLLLHPGVFRHHGFQVSASAAQQGQGVLLGVQLHPFVDAAVHVDGHPGD